MEQGGNATWHIECGNEMAVAAFLQDRIYFGQIPQVIEQNNKMRAQLAKPPIWRQFLETDAAARNIAEQYIKTLY